MLIPNLILLSDRFSATNSRIRMSLMGRNRPPEFTVKRFQVTCRAESSSRCHGQGTRLKRPDGVVFMVVHIDEPRVRVGEAVTEGQVLAQVGNNGLSNYPHIHIGAFKGSEPLQIRFNQRFIE